MKDAEFPYSTIMVTGSMSWDIIMDFPNRFVNYLQPDMLHQINVSFVVDSLDKQLGGTATNIGYAMANTVKMLAGLKANELTGLEVSGLMGSRVNGLKKTKRNIPVVRLLGALGKDGGDHIAFFHKNNIDTRGILVDKRIYNATGTVITDLNDNQIWGFYYGASIRGKDIKINRFAGKRSLFVISANHPDAFLHFQSYAIKHNIDYMYDVGMALSWIKLKDLTEGVAHCKWLVGNDYEIALIEKTLKTTVAKLVEKGITVITTLGDKGVRYESNVKVQISNLKSNQAVEKTELQSITIPAFTKKKVVDPTGAGDAWRGGFVAGISMGLPVVSCLKLGNAVASMAVEKYGTVNYTITKKEVLRRMKQISRR